MNPRRFFIGKAAGFLVVIALVGGFFLLNNYIYQEKQAEPLSLADGQHLGFIRALTDNGTRMDFDDGVWLIGDEALSAAIAAGACEGEEQGHDNCVPAGWYIQNTNPVPESIPLSDEVAVILSTYEMETRGEPSPVAIALEDFVALMQGADAQWNQLPYTITINNGVVVRIEEVYIP